jgi:hypothetical protein
VQGDWDLLIDGVERGNEQALLDRFVGLPADAGDGLVDPYTASVRAQVYDGCRRDESTLNPGKLLDVLAVPGAFRTDAHYCASTLAWEARDSSGDPQGSGAIGGGERPGQQQVAGTVAVSADGQLVLNGPIAALTCPDPVEVESEELVIEAVGSARGEVARLSPSAGLLLADGSNLTFGVATLFAAAGLDPDVDASVTLEVTRDGPGCDGLYGAAPNPLLTVDARLPGMKVRVDEAAPFTATPSLCSQLVDPYAQATFAPATLPTTCSAAGSTTTVSWDDASTVAVDATHTGFYSLTRLELEFTRPGTLTLEVFPWGAGFVRVAVNEYQVTQWASVYEHKGSNGSYQTAPAPCAAATVTVPIDQPGKLRWSLFVFTPEGSGDGRVLTLHFE